MIAGCGVTGDSGGGAAHLPVSGSGPFTPLEPDPSLDMINPPFVLIDNGADLDDPWVVEYGDQMALWVTARRSNVTDIEHSDSFGLEQGFLPLVQGILPDQAWEAGAVSGASLVAGDPVVPGGIWVMFYTGGGAIGWATAPAITLGHNTPERDPMLRAPDWALSIGRFTAHADKTPAGRVRHDLYFTAVTVPTAAQPSVSTCGFASSFTGDRFEIADAPILPLKTAAHAPAETPYRDGALLLYIARAGARDAVAAAHSP